METIAEEKLIGEFMGYTLIERDDYSVKKFWHLGKWDESWTASGIFKSKLDGDYAAIINLPYDTSWDWQIPAWSKIALSVKNLIPYFGKQKQVENNFLWYVRLVSKYEEAVFQNKPEEGIKIICELIEWYNSETAGAVSDTTKLNSNSADGQTNDSGVKAN